MKKSSGRVTRPKAFLKDINLPPLPRQIDTVVVLPHSGPSEEENVKKKSGNGTRPKVLLKDVRLPPLRRETDTGNTICLQTNILIRRQVDRVLGRRPS